MRSINRILLSVLWLFTLCGIWPTAYGQEESWMEEYNFVYLDEILDFAKYEVRYNSDDNFIGQPIEGYNSNRLVLTREATLALKKVEEQLKTKGLCLKIFDTYRPQRAVNNFISWSKVQEDTLMKPSYYPEQKKNELFKLGYISTRSGHSRGSTIDLTIAYINTGEEVDMGGPYDFFGDISHHSYSDLHPEQLNNRLLLKNTMWNAGFRSYSKEWWHYTLNNEPYPKIYFDHVVPD